MQWILCNDGSTVNEVEVKDELRWRDVSIGGNKIYSWLSKLID